MDRIFKPLFSMTGATSQDRERCQFLFWLMKNPMFYRAARPESGREAREGFLRAALGRTQSERRHRLALAGGIRLSDGLSQDIANTVRARSFQAVGVRRRGHGRWGVCPALELQIRTDDLTGRSCSDELLRGSAEQRCAVEYATSKTLARCHGEWR
jgi:hypothetical protein